MKPWEVVIVALLVFSVVVLALGVVRVPDCVPVEECLPRAEVGRTTP